MRNDELERRIQRNVRNLTHKDMCALSVYLKVQVSNRKQGTQENILDHMKSLNHDELLNMSKYIDDLNRSSSSRPRQNNQRTSETSNFCNELTSTLLKNAPIDLESEIHYDLRSDLVVPNITYSHHSFSVPIQMVTTSNDRGNNAKIPNTLQNVQISTSPFYCCSICLLPLTFLAPKVYPNIAQANSRNNTKANFNLTLTENVRKILERNLFRVNNKNDYKWQILIRFVGIDPGQKIPSNGDKVTEMIPPYLTVQINKTQQALWDILPSNCRTKEGKRHPKPVNVSEKISFTRLTDVGYPQELEITWWQVPGLFTYYYMGIYLERKLTVNEMINLFTSNRHVNNIPIEETYNFIESKLVNDSRSTNHSNIDDDEDVVMANVLPIYLLCPVGKSRIEIPIRTITCQHLQCFDAHLFLSMNERRSVWKCPVCDNQATPNDLFCDKYFAKVLNHFKDDSEITEVHVLPDKSFIAITNKNKIDKEQVIEKTTIIQTNEVADLSLIVLDSDDEDDSSNKKKCNSEPIVSVSTPPPPPTTIKVPEPVPMPPDNSAQDSRWKSTNPSTRNVPVSTPTIAKDGTNVVRSMYQSDPRTASVQSTNSNTLSTSLGSTTATPRSMCTVPAPTIFNTPLARSASVVTTRPSSPFRLPVTTIITSTVSSNRTVEPNIANNFTCATVPISSTSTGPKIIHTTVPSHVGAPISVINGKTGNISNLSNAAKPSSSSSPSPYTSKKTVLSYNDLLTPDKMPKSGVDKSSSSSPSPVSTNIPRELPVSTIISAISPSGITTASVSSAQNSSKLATTRSSRFSSVSDIATTSRSLDTGPGTNIVRQRSSVVSSNNSPDTRYDNLNKNSFSDVVRTPSVTMSPVPKRGNRQTDNSSPEPVVCPNFIIQSPPEVENRVEKSPPLGNAPVSASSRINNDSFKKSKIIQSKIPPPPSVAIPSLTIDLTEEDDELAPEPAEPSDIKNRMRFGSKDVKWIPFTCPITSRSTPGAPLSINGGSTNRFARELGSSAISSSTHKRQLSNSGVNYFMPHQNRINKSGSSQSQQSGSAIDLTGDDEDPQLPAKKLRGSRSDDAEDGQVDSSDDGEGDDNGRQGSSLVNMLQPLKHMTKKNVAASRI